MSKLGYFSQKLKCLILTFFVSATIHPSYAKSTCIEQLSAIPYLGPEMPLFSVGTKISINLPLERILDNSERILDNSVISGEYTVKQDSSIQLKDGQTVFPSFPFLDLEYDLRNYLRLRYKAGEPQFQGSKTINLRLAGHTYTNRISSTGGQDLISILRESKPILPYTDPTCIGIITKSRRHVVDLSNYFSSGPSSSLPFIIINNGDTLYIRPSFDASLSIPPSLLVGSDISAEFSVGIVGNASSRQRVKVKSGQTLFEVLSLYSSLAQRDSVYVYRRPRFIEKNQSLASNYSVIITNSGNKDFQLMPDDILSAKQPLSSQVLKIMQGLLMNSASIGASTVGGSIITK